MVDKVTFMETLHSVQEIAKASPGQMTREEISGYFQDMDLSQEQQEMIYQFLLAPQEGAAEEAGCKGRGTDSRAGGKIRAKTQAASPNPAGRSQNPYFGMYLREISAVPVLSKEQQNVLYQRLLSGEGEAMEEISHQWLKKIIRIAREYATQRAFLEDLVQEGNISLLLGLGQLKGKASGYGMDGGGCLAKENQKRLERQLEEFVREGMERYCEELDGEADGENTILAKVGLIHEARKALAEENGTDPTVRELCEYTRLSQEEIADILDLHERARQG